MAKAEFSGLRTLVTAYAREAFKVNQDDHVDVAYDIHVCVFS